MKDPLCFLPVGVALLVSLESLFAYTMTKIGLSVPYNPVCLIYGSLLFEGRLTDLYDSLAQLHLVAA